MSAYNAAFTAARRGDPGDAAQAAEVDGTAPALVVLTGKMRLHSFLDDFLSPENVTFYFARQVTRSQFRPSVFPRIAEGVQEWKQEEMDPSLSCRGQIKLYLNANIIR